MMNGMINQNSTGLSVIFTFLFFALYVIVAWRIFVKAREEGYYAIIPFVNVYYWCKLGGCTLSRFLLFIILLFVLFYYQMTFLVAISILLLYILCTIGIGRRFGKSFLFILGLIFLSPIFFFILAFDESDYQG